MDNWLMYDQVCGAGWFIKDGNAEDPEAIDFIWQSELRRMDENGEDTSEITVIDKVMIVRVRMPWSDVNTEWMMSEGEFEENREDLEVLEVYLRARRKDQPDSKPALLLNNKDRRAYEAAPEKYEVVEKRYLVAWRVSPETRMRMRDDIDY